MTAKANNAVTADLVLTQLVAASRPLVFRAWTEPERLARWWGPEGFTNPRCEIDAQPGGKLRIAMRAPDGTIHRCAGLFLEMTPPEKLAFRCGALDATGAYALEVLNAATFAEKEGGTEIVLRVHVLHCNAEGEGRLAGMEAGWTRSLARLAAYAER